MKATKETLGAVEMNRELRNIYPKLCSIDTVPFNATHNEKPCATHIVQLARHKTQALSKFGMRSAYHKPGFATFADPLSPLEAF